LSSAKEKGLKKAQVFVFAGPKVYVNKDTKDTKMHEGKKFNYSVFSI